MLRKLTFAAVLGMLAIAVPASANHVQCGDTITQDTTLDSDVQCGPNAEAGIIIGAGDVTLQMAGHTITAGVPPAESGFGIRDVVADPFLSRIDIRNGNVVGFNLGVALAANDSAVRKVAVSEGYAGISVGGDRNYAYRNTVDLPAHPSPFGSLNGEAILLSGDDAYAWGNVVTGAPFHGVIAQGERPRLVLNDIRGCGSPQSSIGVGVDLYSNFAVVNRNTVAAGCWQPVLAAAADGTAGGARIRLNQTTGGFYGFDIQDPGAFVIQNTASGATQDGIHLEQPGARVKNNTATDNGRYGIFGPPGTIDGGGNKASGNGDGTTPQCVSVACTPP